MALTMGRKLDTAAGGREAGKTRSRHWRLWAAQGALAALFLLTGGMKLALPLDALTGQIPLPGLFVRFLGLFELLGAVGLVLPGLLNIRPRLTALAATGLTIIMAGAIVVTLASGGGLAALLPLLVGLLTAYVARARWQTSR